jgi:urease accessory protein
VKAHASVRVAAGADGRCRPVELRSAAPLGLRWAPAEGCLYIVGTAFGPLGGDETRLDVVVEAGASLTVRTVAAAIAQPDPAGRPSHQRVEVSVGAGATLRWLPEPAVATEGAVHHSSVALDLADGADLVWREEVLLGRHDQPGGEWHSDLRVALAGEPLLAQRTAIGGAGWGSPAVGAGARAAGSLLVVGCASPTAPRVVSEGEARAAVLPLARPGAALVTALAPDARRLRALLDCGRVRAG